MDTRNPRSIDGSSALAVFMKRILDEIVQKCVSSLITLSPDRSSQEGHVDLTAFPPQAAGRARSQQREGKACSLVRLGRAVPSSRPTQSIRGVGDTSPPPRA